MQNTNSHRRDIDGLRAVAVLSVLFFHYDVPGFGGGLVGVDVFFVISGFLIAGQIAGEIDASRFSLLAFYERRIRRIFPALFFMYALVLLAAALILFPPDFTDFAGSAVYVIPFLANIYCYKMAGVYGAPWANHIVLLHTWSLAVEEQFYLFFPLLMLAITRFGARRYRLVLGLLALLSFLLCVAAARLKPQAAFYLAPFRAWELLLGALLAVSKLSEPRNSWWRGGLALSGLALIAASDWLLNVDTLFPSEYTLLPCCGAVLILHASCDRKEAVGHILDNPVFVRIGLWSYSLYLIHWPLLVLAKYYLFDPPPLSARIALLAATFAFAVLSYRFVEQPFRGKQGLFSRGALFVAAAAIGAGLILGAVAFDRFYAIPRLYAPNAPWSGAVFDEAQLECKDRTPEASVGKPHCRLGSASGPIDALLWGDSHALAMMPVVDKAFLKHGDAALLAEKGGCPPLAGVRVDPYLPNTEDALHDTLKAVGARHSDYCGLHNADVLQWVSQHKIATVILAGHWAAYVDGQLKIVTLTDRQAPKTPSPAGNGAVFRRGLDRLLAALSRLRVRVFVMDDTPEISVGVPYALASADRLGKHLDIRVSSTEYEIQQQAATRIFSDMQRRYGFSILQPQDVLCASGICAIARGGRALYIDNDHLSPFGAMTVQPVFEPIWTTRR